MKKEGLVLALSLSALSTWSQGKFIVSGKLAEVSKNTKLFFSYEEDGIYKKDSTVLTNGEFRFSGMVTLPARAVLQINAPKRTGQLVSGEKVVLDDIQIFFLEKGNTKITGKNVKTAVIKGGKAQEEFTRLNSKLKPWQDKNAIVSEKFMQLWRNSDTTGRSALGNQATEISLNMSKEEDNFIRANPNSFVSLSLLQSRANYIDPAKFGPLYNGLSSSLKNTGEGKKLEQRLDIVMKTSIGCAAINFTQNTKDGQSFTLSSLKGKYVLIDFWASWCGPCRGENPYLLKAYNDYKGKNFEIVSISLDDKKESWLRAIQEDSLPWIQVSDVKGVNNEVAVAYGIRAIPRNFLLDPGGIIIAKNLRGEDLAKKLGAFLK